MFKKLIIFVLLLFSVVCSGQDDTVLDALSEKLEEYFEAMKYEPVEVQKGECDFLIESTSDSLIRTHVAQTIYKHYIDSPVMGSEAIAIHVYDKWFQPGLVKMESDMELLGAKIFAEFNRQSQIGCKAPEIQMTTPEGAPVSLFSDNDSNNRFRVLYFYDTDCSKCRMHSILLSNILSTEDFPIEFYAIYTGDNQEEWFKYILERFDVYSGNSRIVNLWDPEIDSDFQRKYGVLKTPCLFLVAPGGTIVGRGLDPVALAQMLHSVFDEVKLEYGSQDSADLFDGIFASGATLSDVKGIADYIAESTLSKGDTVAFRQMSGDLLYYLSTRSGEGIKEGLNYLIDNYVLSENKVWRSADDSLKIVGFAQIMDDLLSKAEPGSMVTDIKVPGELLTVKGDKTYSRSLRKLRGDRNIIIFYTEGCNICDAEKKAARGIFSEGKSTKKTKVLMVNVDEIMRQNPGMASRLFDSFDLSSLPFIFETDRKGYIQRRYITLVTQ